MGCYDDKRIIRIYNGKDLLLNDTYLVGIWSNDKIIFDEDKVIFAFFFNK